MPDIQVGTELAWRFNCQGSFESTSGKEKSLSLGTSSTERILPPTQVLVLISEIGEECQYSAICTP